MKERDRKSRALCARGRVYYTMAGGDIDIVRPLCHQIANIYYEAIRYMWNGDPLTCLAQDLKATRGGISQENRQATVVSVIAGTQLTRNTAAGRCRII